MNIVVTREENKDAENVKEFIQSYQSPEVAKAAETLFNLTRELAEAFARLALPLDGVKIDRSALRERAPLAPFVQEVRAGIAQSILIEGIENSRDLARARASPPPRARASRATPPPTPRVKSSSQICHPASFNRTSVA